MTKFIQIDRIKLIHIKEILTLKKILCFGDSNTWGHNPVDCSRLEKRWTTMIQDMLPECEFVQDGVCGRSVQLRTGDDIPTNGINVFRKEYITGENDFDLIIIMLGTNDMLNENNYSVDETCAAIRTMIKETREKFGTDKPQFLVAAPIYIREEVLRHPLFSTLYSNQSVIRSKTFGSVYSKMASEENVHFIDAAKAASASPIDGVHLDTAGHEKLAVALAAKIKSILF